MKLCTPYKNLVNESVFFENTKEKIALYDYVLLDKDEEAYNFLRRTKKVFWGDINTLGSFNIFNFFFSKNESFKKIKEVLEENFKIDQIDQNKLAMSAIDDQIHDTVKLTSLLKEESNVYKKESVNVKGLGEYVIRLLGVNTIEQLVYETENLRLLKRKGIKVSLIYINAEEGFLCTRNAARKINGIKNVTNWLTFIKDRKNFANLLSRPVLNYFKIYSESLDTGDNLYALFESQEEFFEKDYFLMMLKKLLFTNFIRVLQSERLSKNSYFLSQAFQQIQSTSLLISSDFKILFSNHRDSLNLKCYKYMFNKDAPCKGCPIVNENQEESFVREVILSDEAYVVHSSKVKSLSNSFYLHIYETEDNSKKRESIKIQRGKLQSLGLVTQTLTHELNNPLTGILELSYEMSRDFKGKTTEDLLEISSAAGRCLSIIEDLKKFSSKKIKFVRINFSKVVKSSLILTKVLTRNTSIFMDLDEDIWIFGSNTLLSQLIFNVIKNSVEAMNGKGIIRISLKKNECEAVLLFKDTGPGIPDDMNNVSLFGTKNKEKGSGFGLFLVNEFVKLHKGNLSFGSLQDKGAYFSINIPLM